MSDFLLGGTYPTNIRLGNSAVLKIMHGSVQVWPRMASGDYGRLYNWWVISNIAPTGWHVPSNTEWGVLTTLMGGDSVAGGKMKEIGTTHWLTPNTGATDEYGFMVRGAGIRQDGVFQAIGLQSVFLSSTDYNALAYIGARILEYDRTTVDGDGSIFGKERGYSLRLIKNDSTWTAGDTLTDIDGNVYPLVKIGTQVLTAANWKCTKYNDGTPIPNVTNNATWTALTTGAMCAYDNDESNV